jgi:peptidyl-prolyl cis-trans isomerase B (cyclophilin B)
MRIPAALLTVALAATIAGCGGGSSGTVAIPAAAPGTTPAATPTATTPTATATACTKVTPAKAGRHDVPKPTAQDALPKGSTSIVRLQTSCGPITIQLDERSAPKTASAFAYLVRKGFYDGLTFHRVSNQGGNDFVIQGGDPLGSGQGGPGWTITEKPPASATYTRGVVAMAKTGAEPAGTSGSQFFIVTAADAGLPPDYAIAGKVIDGDQTVTRISAVPTDPATEKPLSPVVITKATVTTKG